MIYQADGLALSSVREVLSGTENAVVICRELHTPTRNCYTLLVVKDRACAKRLLSVLNNNERCLAEETKPWLFYFTQNELLCFAFEYRQERRLSAFANGQMRSAFARERVCVNLLIECLSSPLPYPLLYLVLTQDNVHIAQDNTVYFTPNFDLSQLDESTDEAKCTRQCAGLLLELLQGKSRKKLKSFDLITKKVSRNAYQSLSELYMDIKAAEIPENRQNIRVRLKKLWQTHKDGLFRLLLVLCGVLVVIALICLLCQLILGDIPLMRIFEHSFDKIGTEMLRK
jgi:hypothetical protein